MSRSKKIIKINSDLLIPERVRSGEIDLARYSICPCGLASDTVRDVIIDRRITLIQPHPQSMLYLCPLCPNRQPTNVEAWFYCDCIAYEHDIPAIVVPRESELKDFRYYYVHSGPSKPTKEAIFHVGEKTRIETVNRKPVLPQMVTNTFFMDQLITILEKTREMRHGPLTFVLFRTHRERRRVYFDYLKQYGMVAKEIGLFSSALRQADFLAEYLGYYRVIESVTGLNGKEWVADALSRLQTYKFRSILIGHQEDAKYSPRNILRVYKRRALLRLRQLKQEYQDNNGVAKYFYSIVRCGIAHGKENIVRGDIAPSYFDVARDGVVLKLLARMAIEEKRKDIRL